MNTDRQSIVVGVHGSAASLAALRWAVQEAALRGASVRVVRAWEAEQRAYYASHLRPLAKRESRDAAAMSLQKYALTVAASEPSVTVTAEVADGQPARVLIDRAAHAGLLVLGSAARGVLGPVARVCVDRAPCPVVLITSRHADQLTPALARGRQVLVPAAPPAPAGAADFASSSSSWARRAASSTWRFGGSATGVLSRPRASTSTASVSAASWASSRPTRPVSSVMPPAAGGAPADSFMRASLRQSTPWLAGPLVTAPVP